MFGSQLLCAVAQERAAMRTVALLVHPNMPFQKAERIYYGHEFCEWRLPSAPELRDTAEKAAAANTKITLVTPFFTNSGIEILRSYIQSWPRLEGVVDEICINDMGALKIIAEAGIPATRLLGRLQIRQLRDPRALRSRGHQRTHDLCRVALNEDSIAFFASQGISRLELDTAWRGTEVLARRFHLSFWKPFLVLTVTRLCPLDESASGDDLRRVAHGGCGRACIANDYSMTHRRFDKPVLLRGNALLYPNSPAFHPDMSPFDRVVDCSAAYAESARRPPRE